MADEVIKIDANGNVVTASPPVAKIDSQGNLQTETRPYLQQTPVSSEAHKIAVERATNPVANFSRALGNYAPILGAIAGGAAGSVAGPPGVLAGETLGAGGGEALRQFSTGEMDPNAISREMLVNAALGPTFRGVSKFAGEGVEHGLRSTLVNTLTGKNVPSGIVDETGTATAGQLDPGHPLKSWIEDLFTPFKKQEILRNQQTELKDRFGRMIGGFVPDTQPEVIADSVKKNLTQGLVDTQTAANQAYSTLRGVGKLNVATDPITGNAIEGPVSTPRTAKVVYDYVLNLAKQAKMSPYEYVQSLQAKGEPLAGTFSDIINAVRKAPDGTPLRIIRNGQLVGYQTNPVGIDQALSIGETAGSGANYGDTLRTFKQTQLGKFKQAMNNDIDESVSRWNNGNVTAKNALEEGRAQTAKKYNLYGGKKAPGTADLLSTTGSGEGELNRLLGDPIHLRRALAGAGDPEALRKDLAGQNLSNIFDDYQKASIGGGKTKSISEFWNDRANQATISDLYTPAEKGNIEQFFKTVQTLDTKANTSGRGALFFRGGTAAVIALPTIYNAATGGDISSGAKGSLGALSIVIGLNQFSRHILLDPIAAKAATIAARSPITSAEGRLATKLTMFALRGEQVKLKMPDGTEKTATIDEKGNLVAPSN